MKNKKNFVYLLNAEEFSLFSAKTVWSKLHIKSLISVVYIHFHCWIIWLLHRKTRFVLYINEIESLFQTDWICSFFRFLCI